jgi:hypothetical protein
MSVEFLRPIAAILRGEVRVALGNRRGLESALPLSTLKLAPAPSRTRSDPIGIVNYPRIGGERGLAQRQRIELRTITTVHKAEAIALHPGVVFEMVLDNGQEPVQIRPRLRFFRLTEPLRSDLHATPRLGWLCWSATAALPFLQDRRGWHWTPTV